MNKEKKFINGSKFYLLWVALFLFNSHLLDTKNPGDVYNSINSIYSILLTFPVFFSAYYVRRTGYNLVAVTLLVSQLAITLSVPLLPTKLIVGTSFVFSLMVLAVSIFIKKRNSTTDTKNLISGDYLQDIAVEKLARKYMALIFGILFVSNPLAIYSYSPEEFYNVPVTDILGMYLILAATILAVCIALLRIVPPAFLRLAVLPTAYCASILIYLYSNIVLPEYGQMTDFTFDQPGNLVYSNLINQIEIVISFSAVYWIFYYREKVQKYYEMTFTIILIFTSVTIAFSIKEIVSNSKPTTNKEFYEPAGNLSLSKKKSNVLILLLDGFSGGTFAKIADDDERIGAGFKDFVWYKNTVTSNAGTVGALPGILGGEKYTVDKLIKSGDDQIDNVIKSAYKILPDEFGKRGFDVNFVDPWPNPDFVQLRVKTYKTALNNDAFNQEDIKSYVLRTLGMLSTFRTLPLFAKSIFYGDGNWHSNSVNIAAYQKKVGQLEYFSTLHDRIVPDSTRPTFTFIHMLSPHSPFLIDGNIIAPLTGNGNYFDESKFLINQILKILKRLKKTHLYDNSQIIIVSDHGWWVDNPEFSEDFSRRLGPGIENRRTPGFFHALLLVKNPNQQFNKMTVDNQLMSNARVPSIACGIIGGCSNVDDFAETRNSETVIFNIVDLEIMPKQGELRDHILEQWEIKSSIFEVDNWRRIPID